MSMVLPLLCLTAFQGQIKQPTGPVKVDPNKIKLAPFVFKEPQPGYLSEFKWTGDIPVHGTVGDDIKYKAITDGVIAAMKANGIPGAEVAIVTNDKLAYSRGFGYANLTTGLEFTPTLATRCGSISKTATALATLRLVELGKLSLDDTLANIFPINNPTVAGKGYKDGWDKIRVRDLLDQCSGIPKNAVYLTSDSMADELKKKMRLSKIDLFGYVLKNVTLDGSQKKWAYTNLNFEILSLIIETKTGKNYGQALQDLVVSPLGLNSTQMFLSPTRADAPSEKGVRAIEARYYQKSNQMLDSIFTKGKKVPEAYGGLDGEILSGAGHIAFSSEAIAAMVIALRTQPKTFLKDSLWKEITTKPAYVSSGSNPQYSDSYFYSKGIWVSKDSKGKFWYSHSAMLMHAAGNYFASKGSEIIVLANSNAASGATLHDQVLSNVVNTYLPNN